MFKTIGEIASFFRSLRDPDYTRFKGRFTAEIWDKGVCISKKPITWRNTTTNAGLNDVLSVYLAGGSQKPLWYFGLVDNAGFSAFAAGDTMSSHAGWTESTAYTESTRQAWTPGSVAGQAVTNPTQASFTMNATTVLKGAFIISNSTKGGSTGTLWSTGAFSTTKSLVNTQVFQVTYTAAASAS